MKRAILVIGALGLLAFSLVPSARAGWTPAKRLTWTTGVSAMPAVAIDSADAIHVVWQDDNSDAAEICYKQSTNSGTTWSTLRLLTFNAGASEYPVIAIDPSDHIHVVWQDDTAGNAEIYYERSEDGGATWGPARRLTWNSGSSQYPAMATDLYGNIHIVWQDDTPGNPEIYYRKSEDGGTSWGAARRLTWTANASQYPAAAVGSGDGIHVVWQDSPPGNFEIYYRGSLDGGTTWNPVKRLTWTSLDSWRPAITRGSGNSLHIVWSDDTPGIDAVYYKRSTNGGTTWSGAKRLTWNADWNFNPSIAMDSAATLHMAWRRDYAYDEADIFYMSSTNGGVTWSVGLALTSNNGRSYDPVLAIDSTDTIHIVWYDGWDEYLSGVPEIYYKKST